MDAYKKLLEYDEMLRDGVLSEAEYENLKNILYSQNKDKLGIRDKAAFEEALKKGTFEEAKRMLYNKTAASYREALSLFESLGDWGDAASFAEQCRSELPAIEGQEEKKRIEAEQLAEERRIAAAEAARKRKKTIMIVAPIVTACLLFFIIWTSVIVPKQKLNKAMSLLDSGDYDAAYQLLEEIGKNEIVVESKYERAVALTDSGDYKNAYELFNGLDYEDSNKYAKYCSVMSRLSGDLEGSDLGWLYGDVKDLGSFHNANNLLNENEYLSVLSRIDQKKWQCVKKGGEDRIYGLWKEDPGEKNTYSAYMNDLNEFILVQTITRDIGTSYEHSSDHEIDFRFIVENGKVALDLIHTDYVIRDTVELNGNQLKVATSKTSSWQNDAYMIFE